MVARVSQTCGKHMETFIKGCLNGKKKKDRFEFCLSATRTIPLAWNNRTDIPLQLLHFSKSNISDLIGPFTAAYSMV